MGMPNAPLSRLVRFPRQMRCYLPVRKNLPVGCATLKILRVRGFTTVTASPVDSENPLFYQKTIGQLKSDENREHSLTIYSEAQEITAVPDHKRRKNLNPDQAPTQVEGCRCENTPSPVASCDSWNACCTPPHGNCIKQRPSPTARRPPPDR